MTQNDTDGQAAAPDAEDEWQLYATAGYAAAENPWDDLVAVNEKPEEAEEWFDGDDFEVSVLLHT